jgi:hypothetical protein
MSEKVLREDRISSGGHVYGKGFIKISLMFTNKIKSEAIDKCLELTRTKNREYFSDFADTIIDIISRS